MKTLVIILLALVAATGSGFGQNLIAVQNGGTPRFYSILQDAIANAQNKDTIYIPGGVYSFTYGAITINKELHLIGPGHYPDSSAATGIAHLNATITLTNGANNSSFTGFYLNGNFFSGETDANEDVDNITISRCNISSINLSRLSTYWLISESVIRDFLAGFSISVSPSPFAQNNLFSNNIISNSKYFGPNTEFRNNLFISASSNYFDGCLFKNNIFVNSPTTIISCKFENNLFFSGFSLPDGSIGSYNIISQTSANTFINQTSDDFSYSQDYHLKSTSLGKNAGKDGTDIGIYGGAFPWKEGSIPFNPHFQQVQVSPKTDANGNLNVNIKVAAQER